MIRSNPRLTPALVHPANRVVAEPEDINDLRKLLLEGEPTPAWLASHLIRPDMLPLLRSGDLPRFFEQRRLEILKAEEDWARKQGVANPRVQPGPRLDTTTRAAPIS